MRSQILVAVALLNGFAFSTIADREWEDAILLRRLVTVDEGRIVVRASLESEWIQVLARHAPESLSEKASAIKDAYAKNPFISGQLPMTIITFPGPLRAADASVPKIAALGTGTPTLSVTTIADGLAKFLVKRAKHELTVAFFESLKKELESQPELTILFPETVNLLNLVDEKIYNFPIYLTSLRETFLADLNLLLDTLPEAVQSYVVRKKVNDGKVLSDVTAAVCYIARELRAGSHPAEILNSTELGMLLGDFHPNARSSLEAFNLISASFRSADAKRYWLDFSEMLRGDPITVFLYLGLLYQEADDVAFVSNDSNISLSAILAGAAPDSGMVAALAEMLVPTMTEPALLQIAIAELEARYSDVIVGVSKAARSLASLGEATQEFLDKPSTELTIQDYHRYYLALSRVAQDVLDAEILGIRLQLSEEAIAAFDKFGTTLSIGTDLALHLQMKQYAPAILDVLEIMDSLLGKEYEARDAILKYGPFVAAVASAENSDQVQDVIEATVLPPGSASIKRRTACNVALQSYMGAGYGLESYRGSSNWDSVVGAWAPLGVAISTSSEKGCAYTLFVSLLDFGAITLYRFENSEDALPEIEFQNLLSPGVALVLGLPRVPLSLSAGYQLGPELRHVDTDGLDLGKPTSRFHFALSVDIPLLNFYTKP